jgi:uncharacterized membrane protein YfcA
LSGRAWIFVGLSAAVAYFIISWMRTLRSSSKRKLPVGPEDFPQKPFLFQLVVGFVTNFFDTLGIGSFATTTTIFKLARMVPDKQIPGTMNVGHTLPTLLQAFLYISIIQVNLKTLVLLIAAAVVGAWWGAEVVVKLPKRSIQLGIAIALSASILFFAMGELRLFPVGGEKLALDGFFLVAGMTGTCVFGALSTLGIGFYAPCMILVSMLGMAPLASFPIMMGSSAFLMPVASSRFLKSNAYNARAAVGLALGGLPAVLIAALIVKSLPLHTLRWLVMAVALWAALLLFRSAFRERAPEISSDRVTAA